MHIYLRLLEMECLVQYFVQVSSKGTSLAGGSECISLGQNFLLVDLREFFFRFRVEGTKKNK